MEERKERECKVGVEEKGRERARWGGEEEERTQVGKQVRETQSREERSEREPKEGEEKYEREHKM